MQVWLVLHIHVRSRPAEGSRIAWKCYVLVRRGTETGQSGVFRVVVQAKVAGSRPTVHVYVIRMSGANFMVLTLINVACGFFNRYL